MINVTIHIMSSDSNVSGGVPGPAARPRLARRIGPAVSARFRALDRRLHIDHTGRSEWIWAVPICTFLATFALLVVQGAVISGTSPALYTPIALLVAAVIAGMSVAYMTPEAEPDDDDGGSPCRVPRTPLDDWSRWIRESPDRLPEEPRMLRRRLSESMHWEPAPTGRAARGPRHQRQE